jgi:hypothetical protein
MFYVAMVRAGSIVMPAETVGPIAAKSGSALGPSIIISSRPVNLLPIIGNVTVMSGQVVFVGSEATGTLRKSWC